MAPLELTPGDQMAIGSLLQRCAWASDERDRCALEDCFEPHAEVWTGEACAAPVLAVRGRAAIADWVIERHRAEFAAGHIRRHMVTPPVLVVRAGIVAARACFSVYACCNTGGLNVSAIGRYDDEVIKGEDTLWRFRRRIVRIDAKRARHNQETER
jgi:hypothetical protein